MTRYIVAWKYKAADAPAPHYITTAWLDFPTEKSARRYYNELMPPKRRGRYIKARSPFLYVVLSYGFGAILEELRNR